ncbi:TPA_asm: G [Glehnia littoralis virus 1]|uniref:G n=1 Tax=Glehnia littoralis virus 1 TaxID=2793728 RepID=A0A8D9PGX9_9RHAB|nr:G [Glehnia littoralis virus 1] [Glehnia littoralis virus 1]DAF42325.1 TPA_asm: G [Glehnia littoralis virus 1]
MEIFSLQFLFVLFNLLVLASAVHDYKYSIGPVCECLDPARPLGDFIKTCYRRCLMDPEPSARRTVQIHQTTAKSTGPSVVECSRIIQEQQFTQMWTFSTEASPIQHTVGSVSEFECLEAISENCPDYNCNHREPDALTPEYHYGSTTTVRRETISLISMPSSLMIESGSIMISPLSTPDLYKASDKKGFYKGKVYLWKDDVDSTTCPFESSASYGCDEYKGSDGNAYYMCAGGRFSVTPTRLGDDVAEKICKGLKLSSEGFLYKLLDESASNEKHSRLYITQTQGMTGDADYLRHKIQHAVTHLDSEICSNQCELLAIESRLTSFRDPIVRVGMTYYRLYGNGTATLCKTVTGCKLTNPILTCGNPPRVGVSCSTNSGLWDPLLPYMVPGGVCAKPDYHEKLSFSLGSESYVVDSGLTIQANSSYAHGVYPTAFSNLHQSGIQLTITDLEKLKPKWIASKGDGGGVSKTAKTHHKIESPSVNIGERAMGIYKSVSGFFSHLEHAIGMIIIIILSIVSVMFSIKLMKKVNHKPSKRFKVVNTEESEEASAWI